MHDAAEGGGPSGGRIAVDFGPGTLEVSRIERIPERVPIARSRELILCRLLRRGISPATLRVLLPERRALIDRLAG